MVPRLQVRRYLARIFLTSEARMSRLMQVYIQSFKGYHSHDDNNQAMDHVRRAWFERARKVQAP